MLTRRTFLQLGVTAAVGIGSGSLAMWARRRWDDVFDARELADRLRETFAYLRPPPEDVDRFVELYLRHHNAEPRSNDLAHVEQTFLLSTDLFQSGGAMTGPVRFVTLYHPYAFPCYNPVAQAG
jgi:hypothetical protein